MVCISFITVLFFSGCTRTFYDWGDYESDLYDYYKSPEKKAEFKAALGTFLQEAEKSKSRVPPGMYAEYGYLQYSFQEYDGAIESYSKEKELFPESAYLMNILIDNIKRLKEKMEKG
jgi:hypothetical protein